MEEKQPYQVLARKWRPKSFADLKGQTPVIRALTHALERGWLHHAYLFTGTRGVGKTSIARILAKSLNCEKGISAIPCQCCSACQAIDTGSFIDLIEVDGASRTRVEDTRDLLENIQYAPSLGRFKIYLIDEVHMLSGHSFNALLKTLEEPPPHVKFILATTDPERIPMTVLSRCLRFNLNLLSISDIALQLENILDSNTFLYDKQAVNAIARLGKGSMRDALSLLEQAIAYCRGSLHAAEVEEMLGISYQRILPDLLIALGALNVNNAMEAVEAMAKRGAHFEEVLTSVLQALHALALLQAMPHQKENVALLANVEHSLLETLSYQLLPEEVQLLYQIGLMGQRDLPFAPDKRTGFEMILLRMILFRPKQVKSTPEKTHVNDQTMPQKSEQKSVQLGEPAEKSLDWEQAIAHLSLTGMARELVKHCVVSEYKNDKLSLLLHPEQKGCLNTQRQAQIETAFSQYLGRSIKVTITLAQTPLQTPALQQKTRELQAKEAVQQDKMVQTLLSTFKGTVEEVTLQTQRSTKE